jgi:hypothetical protein
MHLRIKGVGTRIERLHALHEEMEQKKEQAQNTMAQIELLAYQAKQRRKHSPVKHPGKTGSNGTLKR